MIKFLDKIAEKTAYIIAQILVRAQVKPLHVTIFRFIAAAISSLYFFSHGQYLYNVIGLFLYMSLAILDWTDGHMAQLYKLPKETAPFGRLIDHTSDRLLMRIVLGSIFYGGISTSNDYIWTVLAVVYYSAFFFLTVSLYEFDRMFGLEFDQYPKIEREMYQINRLPSITDKIIYNFLYVHNNSLTRICFTHNFVLIFGIMTNQLLPSMIFLTAMHILRAIGIFLITYQTFKIGPSHSAIVKVLRQYKNQHDRSVDNAI